MYYIEHTNIKRGVIMLSRVVVEIDSELKKEAQIKALQNNATLRDIVSDALRHYLKDETVKTEDQEDIEIN